jgi:tripeptide aminopeptidase
MAVEKRLMHYASFDTQSSEESSTAPSTAKQLVLAKELAEECESLGFDHVELTKEGIVYAYLDANCDEEFDCIGFIAHMDTASEITGANVKCRIVKNYDGKTIQLNSEYSMDPEEFPALNTVIGDDLIVTDGNTLLGADDKAGIAIILEAIDQLIASKKNHGFIAVAFTPDEEIGRGVENFDLKKFPVDYAYTIDGDRIDSVDYETFNAAQAVVTFQGTSIHPGDAKDRMVNASLLAVQYASYLPKLQTPAHTCGRQGFYHLVGMEGICEDAKLTYIIRNHSKKNFIAQKEKMVHIADIMNKKYGNRVSVQIRDQYENMRQYMNGDMRSVNKAKYTLRQCGISPISVPVRGGTDGAMLTAQGLICPNLGTGSFNHHGRFEFASVQKMQKMVEIVLKIVE